MFTNIWLSSKGLTSYQLQPSHNESNAPMEPPPQCWPCLMMWFSSSVRACRTASCLVAAFSLSTIHVTRSQPRNTSRYKCPSTLRLCFRHVPVSTSLQRPNTCFCGIMLSKLYVTICIHVVVPLCHIWYGMFVLTRHANLCVHFPLFTFSANLFTASRTLILCVFFFWRFLCRHLRNHNFLVDFVHLHSNLYIFMDIISTVWVF